MSEEGSPTRANCVFADDEDLNSSIIRKVRSRVSEILPNSISRWFSPSATPSGSRNGKNGSLRRRRESESDGDTEQNSTLEDGNSSAQNAATDAPPPTKRKKQDDVNNAFECPGPSGLNTLITDKRRSSQPSSVQTKFTSSTPTSSPLLTQSQKLAIQTVNKTSSPYEFTSSSTSTSSGRKQRDPGNVIDVITSGSNIAGSSRKHLNIPQMSTDRSNSEPPFSPYSAKHRNPLFGTSLLDPKFSSTIRPESSDGIMEEEELDDDMVTEQVADEKNDDTLPTDVSYSNLLQNGNGNESVSETSSMGDRFPPNELNYTQSEGQRLSGFMGNSRLKKYRGGSTGDLCFSSHLQTEKSLFSERNNLISQMNRPSFNASLYGSTSSLNSSNSRLFANSPFYSGRTMYGGASAYSSKSDLRMKKVLRVPVQIRPSSSLSTLSSSNNSVASEPGALSNTAKRILDIMSSFSSPLSEARKLGNSLNDNVLKIPGLAHNRKRFDEDDQKLNRSVRMQMPRMPYSRPSSSQSFNQPMTNELQVPTISQLLQMKKRLQNNTESVRKTATESSSMLNDQAEYKLPNQQDDSNNNVKQTNKIKNKISRVRESGTASQAQQQEKEILPQVKLPDVQLPGLMSVPTFDIQLPATTTKSATTKTTSGLKSTDKFRFSTPIRLDGVELANENNSNSTLVNFKFSEPDPLVSDRRNASKLMNNNSNKSALNSSSSNSKLGEFKYNPDMAKPRTTEEIVVISSSGGTSSLKSSGSCLDALKSPAPLKSGSCLDAFKTSSPASTTFTKSLSGVESMDSFGSQFKLTSDKWECDACMVRNDSDKVKCVACGTDKPGAKAAKSDSGFGEQFKMTSNMWECPTCMIRNQDDKTKCVSCETAKPGASTVKPFMSAPVASSKPADSGFMNIMAKQSAQWECSECMSRNPSDKEKCMACENPKPGSAPKSTATVPALPNFTADPGFKSLVAQQSSNTWECSACMTRNVANCSKCVCCEQPNPKAAVSQTPSFKFGTSPAKYTFGMPQQSESKEKTEAPKFTFGMPATAASSTETTTTTPKTGFVFGNKAPSSETPKTGFSFGSAKTPITATSTVESKQKISFGMPSAASTVKESSEKAVIKPVTTSFSFGVVPATKADTVDSVKKPDEPKKQVSFASSTTAEFSFTSPKPVDQAKKSEVSAPSAFAVTKPPAMGGSSFAFGKIEEKKDETEKKGGFAFTQPKTDGIKATSSGSSLFGASDPKTTTMSFGGKSATPELKSAGGFSFTSTTTTSTSEKKPEAQNTPVPVFPSPFTAQKSEAPSVTASFSFGTAASTKSSSLATSTITPSFGFGGNKTTTPITTTTEASKTFAFGGNTQTVASAPSTTTENKPPAFGANTFRSTSATTAAAPPVFGSSAASSGFSFGSTANQGKTATTSASFTFGGAPPANPPPAFGASTATPIFGASSTSGGLPGFGSFSSTAPSPAYVSPQSSFGAPSTNAATSIFGASAPAPPAFGSSGSINNSSNVFGSTSASFSFSGNSSASHQTNDEPSAKRSSSGFDFGGNSVQNNQAATPFAFGAQASETIQKPFNFSANAAPTFNFTGGAPGQSGLSATPFQFGSSNNTTSGVFSFGSGNMQETTPNPSAFQFGANTNTNPFAAPPTTGQATTAQAANSQRRKIRAARRMGTSRPVV